MKEMREQYISMQIYSWNRKLSNCLSYFTSSFSVWPWVTVQHATTLLPNNRRDVEKRVKQGLDWMVAWCGKWDHERIRALTVRKSGKLQRRQQRKGGEKGRRKWQIFYDSASSGMSHSVMESVWKWNQARKQHDSLWNSRKDGCSFPQQDGIIRACLPLTQNPSDYFIHMDSRCLSVRYELFPLEPKRLPVALCGWLRGHASSSPIIWSCAWRLCHCTNGIWKNGLRSVWLALRLSSVKPCTHCQDSVVTWRVISAFSPREFAAWGTDARTMGQTWTKLQLARRTAS